MKASQFINQPHQFMEISQESLRIFNGTEKLELRLDRAVDGKISEACKTEVTASLQKFFGRNTWQPRARVHCAIAARGVSLRRLTLPTGKKEEVQKLLPFQIEREFPLPPDQLAWGAQSLEGRNGSHSNGQQEFLVIAVKKETLEDYAGVLSGCGAAPVFTLAALDRTYVCPQPLGAYAVLAIESTYSELITVDGGVPLSVRVLPWGQADLAGGTRALGASGPAAGEASFGGTGRSVLGAVAAPADRLIRLMNGQSIGRSLYVTGLAGVPGGSQFVTELRERVGPGIECREVELPGGNGASAAILGLQRAVETNGGVPPLVLQLKQAKGRSTLPPREQMKWAAAAAGLLLLALLLPYAEALTLKSHLTHALASTKSDQARLPIIGRELDFLQYLQANEPPYLDAMLVLAKAAPQGTHFDNISMNRRGEISLRGFLRDGQQVADLRTKLIASGFFAYVAVEEQAPTPDRQKVNVRMTAQWKPTGSRINPPPEPVGTSAPPQSVSGPLAAGPPPGAMPVPSPVLPATRPGKP
ncbi:MAG TPA: hypothetical protein VLT36_10555 [Candidatus Dormibacteraeota bacterium]|nr:hypothetical protein [Candidatus Dormibacteraeota bacterium]